MDLRQYIPSGNPQKILGTVISVSVVMLVLWLFMVSRMEYRPSSSSVPEEVTSTERRDSVRVMMGREESVDVARERGSSRLFLNALTTFGVLMMILLVVWYWSRRQSGHRSTAFLFKEIGQQTISPGHELKVMEVNEEIWLLGISSGSIRLLHRYPKEKWKEPEISENQQGQSFYNMFSGKS